MSASGNRPQGRVEMRDFPGLVIQSDPHDTPHGAAQEQVNVQSGDLARLKVRPGFRQVTFES